MGNGKATTGQLSTGLTKMRLQLRCIGHGKTRPIDQKDAVPQPTSFVEALVLQALTGSAQEMLEDGKWKLHTGLAIGRGADG